ncbi:hypothetical protein BDZ91DRAFT_797655 [Kalaharituber pfeilii]|nr:hypothetical protein BDZ91DRAFT_797655 [Kalaharituber pfeilii]
MSASPSHTEQHVSYMTKEQLEAYLRDLRTNRPARPSGSRPLPPSAYQQKRMAAAAAAAAEAEASVGKSVTIVTPTKEKDSIDRRSSRLNRRDSHRRSRTTSSVSFSQCTTEYPPEPAQTPVLSGIEDDISDLSLGPGHAHAPTAALGPFIPSGHRKSKSVTSFDSETTVEREIREHIQNAPPIAPLKVSKPNGGTVNPSLCLPGRNPSSASTVRKNPDSSGRGYVPNPSRYVYNEPNQFNKVKYTTNPVPLPSPPPEVDDENHGGRRVIGTREERGRPPVPTIKVKRQSPEPPVIAIVEAPPAIAGSRNITPPSPESVPTISVSGPAPPVPTIRTPDDDKENVYKRSAVPGINISSADDVFSSPRRSSPSPSPQPREQQQPARRPLPTPIANPFRKGPRTNSVYSTGSSATGRPSASCTTCGTSIAGRIVSALGNRFHPDCFRCYHCNEKLEHVGFFPEPEKNKNARAEAVGCMPHELDKRFYCHLDFHELFSPRCKNCQTPIEGEVVVACGETWHVGHFFCAECGDPFTSNTRFVEKDKYAWCLDCYAKRYSSKCKRCKKPVTETVVKAMGGEWHVECFCCAIGQKAMKKCFRPIGTSSGSSSAAPHTHTTTSVTNGDGHGHGHAKVTKPKERGMRKARSIIGMGLGRTSVDSGYGGEDKEIEAGAIAAPIADLPQTPPRKQAHAMDFPATPPPPPRPSSTPGVLLKRMASTRLGLRSSTPSPSDARVVSPPTQTISETPEKQAYSPAGSPQHLEGIVPPPRSSTPIPPLMRNLVAGLLAKKTT